MLARISRGTAHALGLTFTRGRYPHRLQDSVSVTEDSEEVIIDLDILLHPVHDFLIPWWRYAGECRRTLAPMCNSLQNLLSDDVERIAQLLLSLEPLAEEEDCDFYHDGEAAEDIGSPCSMNIGPESQSSASYRERPPHRQHSHPKTPLVIPGSHISIPTIIITPCETQRHETSALVPLQDSAFGSRLTVPYHRKLNQAFPPMVRAVPSIYMSSDLHWKWMNGHWQALLPGLDEQISKGMYSRAISRRKTALRHSRTSSISSSTFYSSRC